MLRHWIIAAAAGLFALPMFGEQKTILKKERPVPGSYIVVISPAAKGNVHRIARELAGRYKGVVTDTWEDALYGFAVRISEAGALGIATDPRVVTVEEDSVGEVSAFCVTHCAPFTQTDSRCNDAHVPWQMDRIDQENLPLDGVYENTAQGGLNVRLYIIDSGVNDHSEFDDRFGNSRLKAGWSADGGPTLDRDGHGTRVASLAAGVGSGVAKRADIIPVRIDGGSSWESAVISGINWIIQHHQSGPAVANISLNFGGSSTLDAAANNLVADGVVVVAAAGNAGRDACSVSPARASGVIAVGASTKSDRMWPSSNYGSCVPIYAPGEYVGAAIENIFTDLNCSPGWTGTSYAAPVVAGVAALAYAYYYHDGYTPAQIKNLILSRSVRKITGVPGGVTQRLVQSTVTPWEYALCGIPCSDPRCAGVPPCPPSDK